jgi:arylsulfatase A-like enzyme
MLTGLYPPRHGLRDNGLAPLPEAAVTLAERAREAGLATGAFVAALVLDRQYRLSQGFDVYDQPERPEQQDSSRYAERPAEEVLAAALAWLDGLPADGRFLLWVHLFDPHAPYDAPPEFLEQVAPAQPPSNLVMAQVWAYTAEVARTDDALGGFLGELRARGRLDDTAVVVVADHGEGLWDHEEPNHAPYVYDTTMRVPFLVRYPDGHCAGERSDEITSVVDVAPTLCSALGLAPLEDIDGVDLWRARAPDGRGGYFESYHGYLTYGWAQLAGWADADGKYIHGPAPELYLVSEDRRETRNLLAAPGSGPAAPHSAAGHAEGYRRSIAEVAARPALEPEDFEDPSAERLEAIAALGYATAAPRAVELPGPLELGQRPAPATRREELVRFLQAQQLLDTRRPDEAAPLLRQILADNPGHLAALEKLGLAGLMQGDWNGAIEAFERRLALADGITATFVNLAFACEQVGRLEEARAHLERALELDPEEPTARANLERVRARLAAE